MLTTPAAGAKGTSTNVTRILLSVLFLTLAAAGPVRAAGVEWHRKFEAARELAKQTGKPMLIDFQADWCKPCKEMERSFWPRPEVVGLAQKFVCVQLNFDSTGSERARYRVDRIPAVIFTDPWGNFLTAHFGYGPGKDALLTRVMQAVPGDYTPVADWMAALEKNKESAPALVQVGDFYRRNGVFDLSTSYFKRALKTKEVVADAKARASVIIALGVNLSKQEEHGEARKMFERYLKEFPDGPEADFALLGVITMQLRKNKLAEAEQTLARLKAEHPASERTRQAERQFEAARSQKR